MIMFGGYYTELFVPMNEFRNAGGVFQQKFLVILYDPAGVEEGRSYKWESLGLLQ